MNNICNDKNISNHCKNNQQNVSNVIVIIVHLKLVVPEGIEPSLGTHLVRTVYKAVGASNYTTGPKYFIC